MPRPSVYQPTALTASQDDPKLAGQQACQLLTDCERLVSAYSVPITAHSLHVYHSALATTACSELLNLYAEDCKGVPTLITERERMQDGWLKLLEGHENAVSSVAFSPNGKTIVSGSYDQTVRVWDAATGVEQHKITGHEHGVESVTFSPDGKTIVSGSDDQTVRVWDAATGVEQHKITGHEEPVFSVAFSPDGKTIVSGSQDRTVRLWNAATGVEQHKMTGHESEVESVAFSPDGKLVVSGSYNQTVRVWDAATGVEQHKMTGHEEAVRYVAFSPNGKTIVSRDYSGTSYIWDVDTGARLTYTSSLEIETSSQTSTDHLVFKLDRHDPGWISCSSRGGAWQRVCWIPVQRRGQFAYYGEIVCIGASSGAMTILDLSPLGLAG
jgi:WD40 repeat protein